MVTKSIDLNKIKSNVEAFCVLDVLMKLHNTGRYDTGVPLLFLYTNLATVTDRFKELRDLRIIVHVLSLNDYIILRTDKAETCSIHPNAIKKFSELEKAFNLFKNMTHDM